MIILIVFAFLAGFVTILSPCILSIAPILLAAGSNNSRYKPLGIVTGLIISFSFFTLTLSTIVQATHISPDIFRTVALCIIIFFGLTMIIPAFEHAFAAVTSAIARIGSAVEQRSTSIKTEFISGFVLGVALGLLWTPCAGPILATITTLAATSGITLTTILITLAYSIGAAIPMLLICFGGTKIMSSTTAIAPYTQIIRKIFGVIVIASALAIMLHIDTAIQNKIADWFPTIKIENNPHLEKELDMLKKNSSTDAAPEPQHAENKQMAPEISGIDEWLNSQPLTLAQLKGKVVLLDFWTYTCINCIRTLPHITQWYNDYKKYGFEIIGIHTPEFAFEKSKSHVQDAIKRFKITYPIALDNNYTMWNAYNNHYWPAHYLIDQNGMIVKKHFGEGDYAEMENAIRALLKLSPTKNSDTITERKQITPETYLGSSRSNNQVKLKGEWGIMPTFVQSNGKNDSLELNFIAQHVYLVMQSPTPQPLKILLNGKSLPKKYWTNDINKDGEIIVHAPRAYEIVDLKNDYGQHTLTLQCPQGLNAYVFTFG